MISLFFATSTVQAQTVDPHNPCGLVSEAEIVAVLGEPLVGPAFRENNGTPDAEGDTCRYEASKYRSIAVTVNWEDGGLKLRLLGVVGSAIDQSALKGVLTLSDNTEVTGGWDAAKDFLCCEFNAQKGKALVVIDISSSGASLQQAASLADLAVKRLDAPLPTDNANAVALAVARAKARPVIVSACTLVGRAEAEAIVGAPLTAEPAGDDSSCRYAWKATGTDYEQELTLAVTWRGGLSEMRQTQAAIGNGLSFLTAQGLPADQQQGTGTGLDEYAESIVGVAAVHNDVLLSVETGGINNDLAKGFVLAASKRL
ncbi:MAG: hypothetical protein ABI216_08770 [Devosia sp.]